jgi:serine phosphatase RsbU (regulator of sigma subunit)
MSAVRAEFVAGREFEGLVIVRNEAERRDLARVTALLPLIGVSPEVAAKLRRGDYRPGDRIAMIIDGREVEVEYRNPDRPLLASAR